MVVAFYGSTGGGALGVLGEQSPQEAAERLQEAADPFEEASGRDVLPAFELITTVALGSPGKDGLWSSRLDVDEVQRWLDAARDAEMLVMLDFQPGRADFLDQVKRYEKFLLQPEVGVALDPEWVLEPGQRPLKQVGRTDADTINEVSAYLSKLTVENNLPEKLFVIHQFRSSMIQNREDVIDRPGLATMVHIDGFGNQQIKKEVYDVLAFKDGAERRNGQIHNGFKLFYDEDTNMMTPDEAMDLDPRPELISYQ